ncbi:hypothetical protein J5N97_008445 [Dioscorea zingiberensis]|uniref:C2H2-type domain-containing protein n=1 Tax=Dioscorea zingiberensis TaxID=325984 RepID=A0A9D5HKP9_9LILI|nr:hypothetical protein J5N97_008445 [Dioscorea zingiberensis]
MERDGERRHRCRVCRKSFPTGRSLGGHMRSHVVMNSLEGVEEEEEEKMKRSSVGVVNGYGLRENPKKTKRFTISSGGSLEKQCRECGKCYPSWKSLFGHMRCHSDRSTPQGLVGDKEEEEDEEQEGSWSVLSDNEVSGLAFSARKRRSRRMEMAMEGQASSSSALEQEEQEDVALALMMLSRDTGHWNVAESSDKNSVVAEEEINEDHLVSDEAEIDFKPKIIASDDTDDEKVRLEQNLEQCDSRKKAKYGCSTCKKSFQSYQALGGHRAAHKRYPGGCLGLRIDDNRIENTNSDASMELVNPKKGKSHECLICGKCFSSGQALGGHKRSHLVASGADGCVADQNPVIPDLLDLNLPAPVDEESKFNPWWKYDAMVGLISN